MLVLVDPITYNQWKDCVIKVCRKSCKKTILEIFSKELKCAGDCIVKYINKESKNHILELSDSVTIDYKREYPLIGKMEGVIFAHLLLICWLMIPVYDLFRLSHQKGIHIFEDYVRNREFSLHRKLSSHCAYCDAFKKLLRVFILLDNTWRFRQDSSNCVDDKILANFR